MLLELCVDRSCRDLGKTGKIVRDLMEILGQSDIGPDMAVMGWT